MPTTVCAAPRRRRRLAAAAAGVVLAGCGVLGLFGLELRAQLLSARADALAARRALAVGDVHHADLALADAERAIAAASRILNTPLVGALTHLPVLGNDVAAGLDMVEAGDLALQAARAAVDGVGPGADGLQALAPTGGGLPLERLEALAAPLAEANALLEDARVLVDPGNPKPRLAPLVRARRQLAEELSVAQDAVGPSAALLESLPELMGADGPRRYFVGAQSPAELRGTGGVIGAYAVLTVDAGRLSLSEFRPVQTLPNVEVGAVEAPNPDYAARYDRYGGAGVWLNVNMTPDFPSAATAILRLYEQVTDQRLDGVVVADPGALAALVEVTGPVEVPGQGVVTAADIVPLLSNRAYVEQDDPAVRKELLGEVAGQVLARFLSGEGADALTSAPLLATAVADGHLLVYSTDPRAQEALVTAGVDGGLQQTDRDYIGLFANNAGGNKLDYYARRHVRHSVVLQPDGSAASALEVTLGNEVPDEPLPAYVVGPFDERFSRGESVTLLDVRCAKTCSLRALQRDGTSATAGVEHELGHPVYTSAVRLMPDEEERLDYQLSTAQAWQRRDGVGVYELVVQGQATLTSTHGEITVRTPPGTRVVEASEEGLVGSDTVTWSGPLDRLRVLRVIFTDAPTG